MKNLIILFILCFTNFIYSQEDFYECSTINDHIIDPDFEKLFKDNGTEASLGAIGKSKLPVYVVFTTKKKHYYVTELVKLKIDKSIIKNGCANIKIYTLDNAPFTLEARERKKKRYTDAFKRVVMYECIDCATKGNFSSFLIENEDVSERLDKQVLIQESEAAAELIGKQLSDSIQNITYGGLINKKPIFGNCAFRAFNTSYIDSIANKNYDMMLEIRRIEAEKRQESYKN